MPVIILGGIYGGVFTPTEASAVAVFYALIVGVVIYREIRLRRPVRHPAQVGHLVGGDHVHHCQRRLFAFLITRAGCPMRSAAGWSRAAVPPALFLLG